MRAGLLEVVAETERTLRRLERWSGKLSLEAEGRRPATRRFGEIVEHRLAGVSGASGPSRPAGGHHRRTAATACGSRVS
jgi:hypothetical protein